MPILIDMQFYDEANDASAKALPVSSRTDMRQLARMLTVATAKPFTRCVTCRRTVGSWCPRILRRNRESSLTEARPRAGNRHHGLKTPRLRGGDGDPHATHPCTDLSQDCCYGSGSEAVISGSVSGDASSES